MLVIELRVGNSKVSEKSKVRFILVIGRGFFIYIGKRGRILILFVLMGFISW